MLSITAMKSLIFKYSTLVFILILLCTTSASVFACSLCATTCVHDSLGPHHSDTEVWSTESSHPATCDCTSQESLTCSKRLSRNLLSDEVPLAGDVILPVTIPLDTPAAVAISDIPTFTSQSLKIHRTVVLRN